MKTERRHELQTNELANWLAGWIETIAPYWKLTVGACLLLCAVWFAVTFVRNSQEKKRALAWSDLFQQYERGVDLEELAKVHQRHADAEAGLWALQTAADVRLAQGNQQLFQDRKQATAELDEARDTYQSVVDQAKDPLLKRRALFGLAQTLESLNDFGTAEQRYREVAETWPATAVGELAQKRLEVLQRPSTQGWYDWFAKQEPVASRIPEFEGLQDLSNLPESPDFSVPEAGQMLKPPGDATDGPSPNEFQPFRLESEDNSDELPPTTTEALEFDPLPSTSDESLPSDEATDEPLSAPADATDATTPAEEEAATEAP